MVLACYNLKGGVGKTATAVNLSWLAARSGLRTLLWDLDPQGAATFHFRIEAHLPGGAKALARRESELDAAIRGTDYPNLDLLPADLRLRKLDGLLEAEGGGRRRLKQALEPVMGDYDLVMLDCPPSIGRTVEGVLHAADALLVPLLPAVLSLRTLDQLIGFARERELKLPPLLPFFTMVDAQDTAHRDLLERVPLTCPQLMRVCVPRAREVERMSVERRPLGAFAPSSPAALAYTALWTEMRGRLGL
jgi:chromosome partitioning protein